MVGSAAPGLKGLGSARTEQARLSKPWQHCKLHPSMASAPIPARAPSQASLGEL